MRSPLNAILLTAQEIAMLNDGQEISYAVESLIQSGSSMQALLDDMVDFSRKKLGLGIGIARTPVNLHDLCAKEIRQHKAAHPDGQVDLNAEGNLLGLWDGLRLRQVLRNLLSNATTYGASGVPIRVVLKGTDEDVRLEVRNRGEAIDADTAGKIFEPLQRGGSPGKSSTDGQGLGLGLYIVREIARAHGGDVSLRNEKDETVFAVILPR